MELVPSIILWCHLTEEDVLRRKWPSPLMRIYHVHHRKMEALLKWRYCKVIRKPGPLPLWFGFPRGISSLGTAIEQPITQWWSKENFRHEAKIKASRYLMYMAVGHAWFSLAAKFTLRSMQDQVNEPHESILIGRLIFLLINRRFCQIDACCLPWVGDSKAATHSTIFFWPVLKGQTADAMMLDCVPS